MGRKRRGHGEGGVYQRESDGRWLGSVIIGPTPDRNMAKELAVDVVTIKKWVSAQRR
jgi:hypothetical protein